jgi:hypothetical protein
MGMAAAGEHIFTFLSQKYSLAPNRSLALALGTWMETAQTTGQIISRGEPISIMKMTSDATGRMTDEYQMVAYRQSRSQPFVTGRTVGSDTLILPQTSELAGQPLRGYQTEQRGKTYRVLVGCEFSGVVRQAFRDRGYDAWSCDLLPTEDGSPYHIQCDIMSILDEGWDMAIFHPPCTHLAVSGARWFADKKREQEDALEFVRKLLNANIPRIALENPVSIISTRIRKPDQYVQPWQFGHGETKKTGLWLKNLPPLVPTNIVDGRTQAVHKMGPSPTRWKDRSRTYQGIAEAMAEQWGSLGQFKEGEL